MKKQNTNIKDAGSFTNEVQPLSAWNQEEIDACSIPPSKGAVEKVVDIDSVGKFAGKALAGIGLVVAAMVYMLRGGDR